MGDITIRPATTKDKKAIYDLLLRQYLPDMPLTGSFDITGMPSVDEWLPLQFLDNGLTIVATTPDNTIVGVAVNTEPTHCEDNITNINTVKHFLGVINEKSNGLAAHLNSTTIRLRIMVVAAEYRGRGISKRLIYETERTAKSAGYSKIFSAASGSYMAAAFRRQNWVPVFTYIYKDYLKHVQDFKLPEEPHDRLTIFEHVL